MAWSDDEITRLQNELAEGENRSGQPGGPRRRLAWALLAPAVLLAVAIGAALARSDDDRKTDVAASRRVTTTAQSLTTAAVPTTVETTTTTVAVTTTTAAPATTTTAVPRTTTTAAATTVPTTTTTTADPNAPPGPACKPSSFQATSALNKATFRPGETVTMTANYRNVSGQTCYWASQTSGYDVENAAGTKVVSGPRAVADAFRWVAMAAGETKTVQVSWDLRVCGQAGCAPAPPGTYWIVHVNEPFGSTRAGFQLLSAA